MFAGTTEQVDYVLCNKHKRAKQQTLQCHNASLIPACITTSADETSALVFVQDWVKALLLEYGQSEGSKLKFILQRQLS